MSDFILILEVYIYYVSFCQISEVMPYYVSIWSHATLCVI